MIYVDFQYYSVSACRWLDSTQEFDNVYKAERFIRKVKSDRMLFFVGYRCDNPEDNEYLNQRI